MIGILKNVKVISFLCWFMLKNCVCVYIYIYIICICINMSFISIAVICGEIQPQGKPHSDYLAKHVFLVSWVLLMQGVWASADKILIEVAQKNSRPTSSHGNVNTLRPRQNGRYFADHILKCIFLKENVWILVKIALNFVTKGPIDSIPALDQIIAWLQAIIWTNYG